MPIRYLYTISKLFCFDIEFRVLRYRCFFRVQPGLPTQNWTQIAVCTLHCKSIITRGSCAARAALSLRSGAPEAALGGAPHPLHRAQHRPQPPERGLAAGAAAAAAGAGINGTQERVILGDKN